jgi:hypothetical protein
MGRPNPLNQYVWHPVRGGTYQKIQPVMFGSFHDMGF